MQNQEQAEVGFLYDNVYLKHQPGAGHPESPQRLRAILQHLNESGLIRKLTALTPKSATPEDILLVHTQEYFNTAKEDILSGEPILSTGDTHVCPASWEAALFAAGGALHAVDFVFGEKGRRAFCAIRPPGHHAAPEMGMGFCVFNNAAIAARYAQKKHGIKRVMIIDWDIHHGNGTQDAFYEDGSVFYASTHQHGIYPMTVTGRGFSYEEGEGEGVGSNLNIPLREGDGDREIIAAFQDKILPAGARFCPELVIISAGFDARENDPIGGMQVTDEGFRALTKIVKEISEKSAQSRIVSVLEGGYNIKGLASAVGCHLEELLKR